jgi:hypothetical protein
LSYEARIVTIQIKWHTINVLLILCIAAQLESTEHTITYYTKYTWWRPRNLNQNKYKINRHIAEVKKKKKKNTHTHRWSCPIDPQSLWSTLTEHIINIVSYHNVRYDKKLGTGGASVHVRPCSRTNFPSKERLGLRTRNLATAASWEYRRGSVSCWLTLAQYTSLLDFGLRTFRFTNGLQERIKFVNRGPTVLTLYMYTLKCNRPTVNKCRSLRYKHTNYNLDKQQVNKGNILTYLSLQVKYIHYSSVTNTSVCESRDYTHTDINIAIQSLVTV